MGMFIIQVYVCNMFKDMGQMVAVRVIIVIKSDSIIQHGTLLSIRSIDNTQQKVML